MQVITNTHAHYTVINNACNPHVHVIAQPMHIMSVAQDFMLYSWCVQWGPAFLRLFPHFHPIRVEPLDREEEESTE